MKAEKMSFSNEEIGRIERFASEKFASVLTIIMTDIVGSVVMMQKIGSHAYQKLKAEYHDKPLFEIVTRQQKGTIVKNRGDGFMCVFSEPSTAVERALEIQQYFSEHKHFELRIGIAMGQCMIDWSGIPDIISMHSNIAARAESLCKPGHILVTHSVFESASNCIPRSICAWKNHGFSQVKSGENFHEYIEPYNKNLINPMRKLAKGTQSCVPTFENINISLTQSLYKALNFFILFIRCLIYLFIKKPFAEMKFPPSLYTIQEKNNILDECGYSESEQRDNICIPLNRGAISPFNLIIIFSLIFLLLSVAA